MTILLFWTAVGALMMAFTARKALGRVPLEEVTRYGYSAGHSVTTKFEFEVDRALRRWFRIAFFAGLSMFLIAGSLAALVRDMG